MKRLILLATMLLCCMIGINAQTDMTSRITNPSFEKNGLEGWTNDGMQSQNNTSFKLKVGNVYAEKWTGNGSKVGNASLKQTLTDMPNGEYTLSVVAQNIQQDSPTTVQTGVYLQANSDKTQVGVAGSYSVNTTLTNGKLNIAFVLSGATGNYVCVDNFKLVLNSCTLDQLGALVASAQELVAKKMGDKAKSDLETAIAKAQAQSSEASITDVAAELSGCIVTAKASVASFAAFDAAIAEAQGIVDKKMSAAALSSLEAALNAAKAKTTADDITSAASTLDKCIATAKTSVESYASLLKAIDEANKYYATSPANGADALKTVIDETQKAYDEASLNDAGCAAAVTALESAVIACRVANGTGTAPKVSSEHFMPVGCVAALGRMTATGSNIIERGYVWATHPNPTVADNRSTLKYDNNGDIYELSPLQPATQYYVRAYAMTKTYAVAYGEEQRIFTLPKATCRWSYDEAGDAATNERIRNAVRDACDFYNTWTSTPGFHLNAHYVPGAGAGGGTADCSYGGYMRVSQSVSYQRTGTLLHESNHGVGVGTSHRWKNWDGSGLREDGGERGQWLGWRATQMVRFFDHNNTSILNGDGTHMWPYGINGAHEDDNRKILYIANTLITHAVHQDGLAAVDGIGASAAYTFEYEDGKSYFITNEDAACNAGGQAYLYETSTGQLKWGEASASELTDDSSFAWQFEYVPEKAYYRIRNAKSGKYFTYSGSSIKTTTKSKPGNTENFQLMVGYPEITVGLDKTVKKRGYWIQAGTGDFQPYTLTATTANGTKGEKLGHFSPLNASKQRWLILTAEEAKPLAGANADEHVNHLRKLIDGTKAMLAVPHTDKTDGATNAAQTLVDDMAAKAETLTGIAEAKAAVADMEAGIRAFLDGAVPDEIGQPYDLSFLILEPDFATTDSWVFDSDVVPTFKDGVGMSSGKKFKMTQTLADMPVGIYELKVQACQRPVVSSYIGNSVVNKIDVAQLPDDVSIDDPAQLFANGAYDNNVVFKLNKAGDLAIIAANNKTSFAEGDITLFTNFRLYYFGNTWDKKTVVAIDGISEASSQQPAAMYDLTGRRIAAPAKGIYIQNGKKYIVK